MVCILSREVTGAAQNFLAPQQPRAQGTGKAVPSALLMKHVVFPYKLTDTVPKYKRSVRHDRTYRSCSQTNYKALKFKPLFSWKNLAAWGALFFFLLLKYFPNLITYLYPPVSDSQAQVAPALSHLQSDILKGVTGTCITRGSVEIGYRTDRPMVTPPKKSTSEINWLSL